MRNDHGVGAAQLRDRQGMNRQHQAGPRVEPKMHVVDHKVMSTLMPHDDGLHGSAATAQMSSAVRNEVRKAQATTSTSIVLVKDKKVWYPALTCFSHVQGGCAAALAPHSVHAKHHSGERAVRNAVGLQDRATVEQALDPRTRLVLFKLLNRGLFTAIHGCVSTGKEANVYCASAPESTELAVKVYKTSILVFKDRDRCGADPICGAGSAPPGMLCNW